MPPALVHCIVRAPRPARTTGLAFATCCLALLGACSNGTTGVTGRTTTSSSSPASETVVSPPAAAAPAPAQPAPGETPTETKPPAAGNPSTTSPTTPPPQPPQSEAPVADEPPSQPPKETAPAQPSAPPAPSRVRIGGIFIGDLPIEGTVVATGADGVERTAKSDRTGAFVLDGDFLLPVALRGEAADGGRVLHAVLARASNGSGIALAHVTPLTDLVAARLAADGNPASTWSGRSTILRNLRAEDVERVHDALARAVEKARATLGLTEPPDFASGERLAKARMDALLENVRAEIAPLAGGVTVYALRQAGFPANAAVWSSKDDTVPVLPFRADRKVSPSAIRDAGLGAYEEIARVARFDVARHDPAAYKAARAGVTSGGLANLTVEQFVARFAKLLDALPLSGADAAARAIVTYFDDDTGKRFERALALVDGLVASAAERTRWGGLATRLLAHDSVAGVATFALRYGDGLERFGEWNMALAARPVGPELARPQRVECLAPRYVGRLPPPDVASYVKGSVFANRCDIEVVVRSCVWVDDAKGGRCTGAVTEQSVQPRADSTLGDAIDTRAIAACGPGDDFVDTGAGNPDVRVRLRTTVRCEDRR